MIFDLLTFLFMHISLLIIEIIVIVSAYLMIYYLVLPKVKFLRFLFEEPKEKKRRKIKTK